MIFDPTDHPKLIAEPGTFRAPPNATNYQRTVVRTAVALEITAQLVRRGADPQYRGGTPLQVMLEWPPRRASLDDDYVTLDAERLWALLQAVVAEFKASGWNVRRRPNAKIPGFKADVVILNAGRPIVVRVDVLQVERMPTRTTAWHMPDPWGGFQLPRVATLEAQAGSKLLLTADPPFGRTLGPPVGDQGRKSRIKDLFDLSCLGGRPLDAAAIRAAVDEEVARKSQYLRQDYHVPGVVAQAVAGARVFMARRGTVPAVANLWRAYTQVRPTIRPPFTELDLRIAAACTQHALLSLPRLDWQDSWHIHRDRAARRKGNHVRRWPEGADFTGPDAGLAGLDEAWALPP